MDVTLAKLLADTLARSKGLEEEEVTGQLFGGLPLTLMHTVQEVYKVASKNNAHTQF